MCIVATAFRPYLDCMIVIAPALFFTNLLRFALALVMTLTVAIPHSGYSSASHMSATAGVHATVTHDGAADGAGTGGSAVAAICAVACIGSDPYAVVEIDQPPVDAGTVAWFADLPSWRIAAGPDPAPRPPETLRPA